VARLEPEQLFERRDLAVTTDFRDVLGEVVSGHLGQKVDQVFPGYTPKTSLGLLTVRRLNPERYSTSRGKYLSTEIAGFGAA
jgi:hypothetical protein